MLYIPPLETRRNRRRSDSALGAAVEGTPSTLKGVDFFLNCCESAPGEKSLSLGALLPCWGEQDGFRTWTEAAPKGMGLQEGEESGRVDLQKRERQIPVNTGLDLDLDVQIQLEFQLQPVVVHHVLAAGAAALRVVALRRIEWLRGSLPAAAPGDLAAQRARVGYGAIHGLRGFFDPVEGLHVAGDLGGVWVGEPLLLWEVLRLLLLGLGLRLGLSLGADLLLGLGFVIVIFFVFAFTYRGHGLSFLVAGLGLSGGGALALVLAAPAAGLRA